jgi:two-component sensor histidine kinase
MTARLSFDTLAFAKRLAAAGMESRQAQALAEALNDIVFDTLATKNDLRDLEAAGKSGIEKLEFSTRAGIERLEAAIRELEHRLTNSLTVRTGAMIAGSTALIVAVLGALNSLQ